MQLRYGPCPLVNIEHDRSTVVIRVLRPVLVATEAIETLARLALTAAARHGAHAVVLNLAAVEEFNSALLGKLVGLHKRLRVEGRRLLLCDPQPHLACVLERLRLTSVMTVCADEREAALLS
jgi:anti-anti-sigma factor